MSYGDDFADLDTSPDLDDDDKTREQIEDAAFKNDDEKNEDIFIEESDSEEVINE